jgi:hypothetical protein
VGSDETAVERPEMRIGAPNQLLLIMAGTFWLAAGGCLVEGLGGDGDACVPHFSDGEACEPVCDASTVVILNGNYYCTQTCGPNNECPSNHVCVRFMPEDRPSSACLPPCNTGSDCPNGFLGLCSDEGVCGL